MIATSIAIIYPKFICTHNNNIPVNIPSHPYVLLDRNFLCNCDIEAKRNFLLESLAACIISCNFKYKQFSYIIQSLQDHNTIFPCIFHTFQDHNSQYYIF